MTGKLRFGPAIAKALLLLALILAAPSPGLARTLVISARFPAGYADAGALRRLTVAGFQGPGGTVFAGALEAELTAVQFDGGVYFTLLSANPAWRGDPASLGRSIGADGVLLGDVTTGVQDSSFEGLSLGCTARNENGCAKYGLVTLPCTRRTFDVTANLKLVRVADGRIVYSAAKAKSGNITWCAGGAPGKSDEAALLDIVRPMVAEIRTDIAPYNKTFKVKIKDSDRGLPKDLAGLFKTAVKSAPTDLNTACGLWVQVDAGAPNHPATVYDLALCEESVGDLPKAAALYQAAQAVLPAGDRDIRDAMARVKSLSDAKAAFEQQEQARRQAEEAAARQAAEAERLAAENARQAERRAADAAKAQRTAAGAARAKAAAQTSAAKAAQNARRHDVASKFGAAAADAILSGRVQKGMTIQQVLAAKGQPSRREKITAGDEQWFYPGQRVIFSNGRVSYIGS